MTLFAVINLSGFSKAFLCLVVASVSYKVTIFAYKVRSVFHSDFFVRL